jgi:hypothetical protein
MADLRLNKINESTKIKHLSPQRSNLKPEKDLEELVN